MYEDVVQRCSRARLMHPEVGETGEGRRKSQCANPLRPLTSAWVDRMWPSP